MEQHNTPIPTPPVSDEEIPFTPVPVRARRDGWTPERQREVVRALREVGSVSTACKAVGKSPRSFYTLQLRDGADSFNQACDLALEIGRDAMRAAVLDRCLHGALVPTFRRGKLTGYQHKYFDKLAISVLGGRERSIEQVLEDRLRMRRFARADRELKAERRERERKQAAYEAEARAMIERGEAKKRERVFRITCL